MRKVIPLMEYKKFHKLTSLQTKKVQLLIQTKKGEGIQLTPNQ